MQLSKSIEYVTENINQPKQISKTLFSVIKTVVEAVEIGESSFSEVMRQKQENSSK
jgi:hypothetical protein